MHLKIDFNSWYEDHYHELTGNGIWFRGGELNTLSASEFLNRNYRVLITRLSTYWDTADSFTHKLIYQLVTSHQDIYADLSYLPSASDASLFDSYSVPWLIGTTTKRDALQFDMIAFSNSIVQEILNIPSLLLKSNIPLRKSERLKNSSIPLVILGGANALYSSALCIDDPMIDGIFVGEDANLIKELFRIAQDCKKSGLSKVETLEKLETVQGFFQPDIKRPTTKFTSAEISQNQLMVNAPVMYTEEQMGTGNLQISEGCPCFCSFCAESWGRKPYRELSFEKITEASLRMKSSMGLETVELYSFNFNMHHDFYRILFNLAGKFSSIGLKSQRFDTIAAEPELVKHLHAIGKTSITCGLEGISSRLRKYLHKSLDDQELKTSLSILIRAPIRELKIFLIATGKETEDDFTEFCALLAYINTIISMAGRKPRIIFSMTPLVRFPYTPLESEDAPEPLICREAVLQTERFVRSRGFEFRDSAGINDYLVSQILTRIQDSHVAEAVFSAVLQSGFVYYSEIPVSFIQLIESELERRKLSIPYTLNGLRSEAIAGRPVKINVRDSFLAKQAESAASFTDNGFCLGTLDNCGTCHSCGACEDTSSISSITRPRTPNNISVDALRKRIKERQELVSVAFKINIPFQRRGIPRKNIGIALARAIMLSEEKLVEPFLSFGESFIDKKFESDWIYGDDILTLRFHKSALDVINKRFGEIDFIEKINKHLEHWGKVENIVQNIGSSIALVVESPYKFDGNAFFKKYSIKYVNRKSAENTYRMEFTKDSLKKKIMGNTVLQLQNDGCILTLTPLEKFDLQDFLKNAFVLPSPQHRIRLKVRSEIHE